MALSQMNVRIDNEVRVAGNLALENAGFTPARAVRGLWQFAARNRNNPERIRRELRFLGEVPEGVDEREERARAIREGWSLVDEGLAALGLSLDGVRPLPFDELKEQAYRERWEAKGLL